MKLLLIKKYIWILVIIVWSFNSSYASANLSDQQIEVSLRMIGHQVLLNVAEDSTSLVLPIIKDKEKFKIHFDTEFELKPFELVNTIKQVIVETDLATNYVVEVLNCKSGLVVYSFEISDTVQNDIIPCSTRDYPNACYELEFTLVTFKPTNSSQEESLAKPGETSENSSVWIIIIVVIIILCVFLFYSRRKKNQLVEIENDLQMSSHIIPLGGYRFNSINGELIFEEQKFQLTSKEADLLQLLNRELNSTVEREVILNEVWGDEGDYVGRTLDVFISKLRKKLELDQQIKIVNVRGVGYKLILN